MSRLMQAAIAAKQNPMAYSIEEFAAIYGVGRTSVFEEISSGRLRTYKVGRRRYISAEAAAEWQRAREAEAMGEVA